MLRVRDIMTTDVVTLSPEATLEDAERCFADNRIGGVPVVRDGKVVGIVSKSDLVNPARQRHAKMPMSELMEPVVHSVRPGNSALTAVRIMLTEGIHRVPVIWEDGRLAGILSTIDVLKALERGQSFAETDGIGAERHSEPEQVVPNWQVAEYKYDMAKDD